MSRDPRELRRVAAMLSERDRKVRPPERTEEEDVVVDFNSWGPLTVLAVAVVLLVVIGGLVVVITGGMTFERFIIIMRDLAAALGLGAAVGRGFRLAGTPVPPKTTRRRRT